MSGFLRFIPPASIGINPASRARANRSCVVLSSFILRPFHISDGGCAAMSPDFSLCHCLSAQLAESIFSVVYGNRGVRISKIGVTPAYGYSQLDFKLFYTSRRSFQRRPHRAFFGGCGYVGADVFRLVRAAFVPTLIILARRVRPVIPRAKLKPYPFRCVIHRSGLSWRQSRSPGYRALFQAPLACPAQRPKAPCFTAC